MTEWVNIEPFPRYEVSDEGDVRNTRTQRVLRAKINQQGIVGVGLMREGLQYHRSVPLLVCMSFVPRHLPTFDTPINLDGDRQNNYAWNLRWRPRWYAVEYNRQFKEPYPNPINSPIVEKHTRVKFANSWECSVAQGFLERDLVLSILNKTYVWPSYEEFEVL